MLNTLYKNNTNITKTFKVIKGVSIVYYQVSYLLTVLNINSNILFYMCSDTDKLLIMFEARTNYGLLLLHVYVRIYIFYIKFIFSYCLSSCVYRITVYTYDIKLSSITILYLGLPSMFSVLNCELKANFKVLCVF